MTFEDNRGDEFSNADIYSDVHMTASLKSLKSDAISKIESPYMRSKLERTFNRAVQDAEHCAKMRAHSAEVTKVEETLPLTRMKRDWGEVPKDGLAHYEKVCKDVATNGCLASGLPQDYTDKLVAQIFSSPQEG